MRKTMPKNCRENVLAPTATCTKNVKNSLNPYKTEFFTAIEEYARERAYAFVFDKAGDLTIVYADSKYDINDAILAKLGVVANSKSGE